VIVYSEDEDLLKEVTEIDHDIHGVKRVDNSTFTIYWFINRFNMEARSRNGAFNTKLKSTKDSLTFDLERNADAF